MNSEMPEPAANVKQHWAEAYRLLDPCADAWKSALASKSYSSWWRECKRGDWMLWAMARSPEITQGSLEHVRLCWIFCRVWWELGYPWWYEYGEEHHDTRPQDAIEALEAWCLDPCAAAAARVAEAAARAAGGADAAARAVGRVAWAPEEAAWAAGAAAVRAAWAADAAARAAGGVEGAVRVAGAVEEAVWAAGATWVAGWAESLARIAEIIREAMPEPPEIPLEGGRR